MSHPAITVESLDGGEFAFDQRWVDTGDGSWRVELTVTHTGGEVRDAAIRVSLPVAAARDPWWLIPGAFYGENRPERNDRVFPRYQAGASTAADHAAMVSEEWHFRADRAATPTVFCWPSAGAPGLAIATTETSPLGLTGLGFAAGASASLTFPFREFPVTYYGDGTPRPAESASYQWHSGETVTLEFTVHELTADRHDYDRVLRRLHAASAPTAPLRPWVSVPDAADLAAEGLLRWHYDPDPGVLLETVGFDREVTGRDGKSVDRQAMHVGWVSGIPWAYALLRHGLRVGRDDEVDAAARVIDFIAAHLSPSGTLWGVWYREHGWTQSWTHLARGLHSRTLGEATHFLVRALALRPDPVWQRAVRSSLDAVTARQRVDGNLGSVHHAETGEVLSWTGTSGLAWVPALVEAGGYLDAAIHAGEYYAAFVENEYLHGAPEDVDLAPTSEDGYVAVMAYWALFEATGERRWLQLARRAADWTFTFRYSYDVAFEPTSMLGVYNFGTRGADQASSSNQHLHAYGLICTRELLRLAEATGDAYYRERALETLACFRQFVARHDGDFNAYRGMVSERYYQTSCFQPKGMLLTLSHAWSVGVLLLGCEDALAVSPRTDP